MSNNLGLKAALVVIAVIAIGAYFFPQQANFGSTGSRYPNGLSANTMSPSVGQLRGTTLQLDTTDTATSTAALGCIQTTATSTATPIRLVIGQASFSTTTFRGVNNGFSVVAQFGTCP